MTAFELGDAPLFGASPDRARSLPRETVPSEARREGCKALNSPYRALIFPEMLSTIDFLRNFLSGTIEHSSGTPKESPARMSTVHPVKMNRVGCGAFAATYHTAEGAFRNPK